MPYLAERWEKSSDGLTWTFYMRKDVKWVSYDPKTGKVHVVKDYSGKDRVVTADDVVYGIQRTLDALTKSPYAPALYAIKNAEKLNKGEKDVSPGDVGVKAIDNFTVQFTLEKPIDSFPALMALPGTVPQPSWAIDAWKDNWTEPGLINSNGPYVLAEWNHGFRLDLVKNPYWFDASKVQIEKVFGYIINTPDTALQMYKENQLDAMVLLPSEVERVKGMKDVATDYQEAPARSTLPKEAAAYASLYPSVPGFLVKPWVRAVLPALGGFDLSGWTVDVSRRPSGG